MSGTRTADRTRETRIRQRFLARTRRLDLIQYEWAECRDEAEDYARRLGGASSPTGARGSTRAAR